MSARQPPVAARPWLAQSELSVQPQAEQANARGVATADAMTSASSSGRRVGMQDSGLKRLWSGAPCIVAIRPNRRQRTWTHGLDTLVPDPRAGFICPARPLRAANGRAPFCARESVVLHLLTR